MFLDCGCGLTVPAVRECFLDPELSDAAAQALVDDCVDMCADYGL